MLEKIMRLRRFTARLILELQQNDKIAYIHEFFIDGRTMDRATLERNWPFISKSILDDAYEQCLYGWGDHDYIQNTIHSQAWKDLTQIYKEKANVCCNFSECGNECEVIHHHRYEPIMYNLPWLYPSRDLYPLCDQCHAWVHIKKAEDEYIWLWRKRSEAICNHRLHDRLPKELDDSVAPYKVKSGTKRLENVELTKKFWVK